ncbi:MAG: folylpolyglutamate synthase/dihydrofolate synthase family protein [Patescibacteria group bacterium]|jgi:dihydrofolate synthase/folylpolyglutamate synthase
MSPSKSEQSAIDQYIEYLRSFPRFGAKEYLKLERVRLLLKYLGQPQRKLKGFQVAGTNGKGSTTAMIASILRAGGHRTGAFFSPHLVSYTERIQINGQPIAERDMARILKRIQPAVAKVEAELKDRPTWFEVLTAAAALWFAENKVAWVVFEVGLGGRLDSTTALGLKYKVITDIDLDHTHTLGRTIRVIAGEKAGIIQPGSVVVTSNTGTAYKVIQKRCRQVGARLLLTSRVRLNSVSLKGICFNLINQSTNQPISLSLVGLKQPANACLAFDITRRALRLPIRTTIQGLEQTNLPARFQILRRRPLTILDGAHNPAAMKELIKTLTRLHITNNKLCNEGRSIVTIFAAKDTKDYARMINMLIKLSPDIYFPRLTIPGMVPPSRLRNIYSRSRVVPDLKTALKQATLKAGSRGMVLITGSLYLAGEVLRMDHYRPKLKV